MIGASCKKCHQCTRTVSYMRYKEDPMGYKSEITITDGASTVFDACSANEVEFAERPTNHHSYVADSLGFKVDTSTYCKCD